MGKIDFLRFGFQQTRSIPCTCLELVDMKTTHNLFLTQTLTRTLDRQSLDKMAQAPRAHIHMVQRSRSNQRHYRATRDALEDILTQLIVSKPIALPVSNCRDRIARSSSLLIPIDETQAHASGRIAMQIRAYNLAATFSLPIARPNPSNCY